MVRLFSLHASCLVMGGGGGVGVRVDQLDVTFCAVLHALSKDTMILQSTCNI